MLLQEQAELLGVLIYIVEPCEVLPVARQAWSAAPAEQRSAAMAAFIAVFVAWATDDGCVEDVLRLPWTHEVRSPAGQIAVSRLQILMSHGACARRRLLG